MQPGKLYPLLEAKTEEASTETASSRLLWSNPSKLWGKQPQIPWANIINMRNRLIHAYSDIDLDVLWKTVIEDLPPLIAELEKIILSENKP